VSIRPTPSLRFLLFLVVVDPCARGRNVKRTLENLRAGDVELSAEDLTEIGQLLETYPRKGGQYIDGVEHQLHLWN
jgi:hypothetical protein